MRCLSGKKNYEKKEQRSKKLIKDAANLWYVKREKKKTKKHPRIFHICSWGSDDISCLNSWYMCEHAGSLGDFENFSQEIQ